MVRRPVAQRRITIPSQPEELKIKKKIRPESQEWAIHGWPLAVCEYVSKLGN